MTQPSLFPDSDVGTIAAAVRERVPTPEQQLPYRTELVTATPEEIALANKHEANRGARAYADVETARQTARSAKSAVHTRMASWIFHPDERVPLAFMSNTTEPRLWNRDGDNYVRDSFYQRAMRDAQTEGVIWTPFLDAMTVHGVWAKSLTPEWNPGATPRAWAAHPNEIPVMLPYEFMQERADRLIPWIHAQTSARAVEPLLKFEYDHIRAMVARETRVPDRQFLKYVLKDAELGPHLAANPNLTPDLVAQIALWAVDRINPPSEGQKPRAWEWDHEEFRSKPYATAHSSSHAAETIEMLKEMGHRLPDTIRPPLEQALGARPAYSRSTGFYSSYGRPRRVSADLSGAATKALLALDAEIGPETLLLVFDRAGANASATMVTQAALHVKANTAVWLQALKTSKARSLRSAMSLNDAVMADPDIRKIFNKSSSSDILVALCDKAPPAEFLRHFTKLVAKDSAAASTALEKRPDYLGHLSSADIAPLLSDSNLHVSLRTMLALRGRSLGSGESGSAVFRQHFPALFRRAAETQPTMAHTLLSEHRDLVAEALTVSDLAPLLTGDDQKLRMAAVMAMGDVPEAVAPEPVVSRRR